MRQANDGFKISEKDLELRGPGDFFGMKQHGLPELKIANLFEDIDILKLSQKAAIKLIKKDPKLQLSENELLLLKTQKLFEEEVNNLTFN